MDALPRPSSTKGFAFSNLSNRAPGRFLRIVRRLLKGVDHVEREIVPYAGDWHEHNVAALGRREALWVVLGDSLSQGVGATSIDQSWVLQAARMIAEKGLQYRIINLSISGARVTDVLERELPALNGLATVPDLVTVLVGSNDVVRHDLRAELPRHYAALLAALPRGALVAVTDHPHRVLSPVNTLVREAAGTGAVQVVPIRLSTRDLAEDHFHLNDHGYRLLAEDFAVAIVAHAQQNAGPRGRSAAASDV